jgi:hypothetical protein
MSEIETIPKNPDGPVLTGAHWTIYLPTLAVAVTWVAVYFWAEWQEPPLLAIRSIALAIESVVVPLLLLHALARARVLRAGIDGGVVQAVWGFPVRRRLKLGIADVVLAQVRRSHAQRFFGGGALALIERSGKRHLIADLARPEDIAAAINETNRRKDAA